jgi:hypothetical protein
MRSWRRNEFRLVKGQILDYKVTKSKKKKLLKIEENGLF